MHRLSDGYFHMEIDRRSSLWICRCVCLAQPGSELRIVCLPDGLASGDGREVDGTVFEGEIDLPAVDRIGQRFTGVKDLIDTTSLRIVNSLAAIKRYAITPLNAGLQVDQHAISTNSQHRAESHATLGTARSRHEHLMVAPL